MNNSVIFCALLLAAVCGFEMCIGCLAIEGAMEFKKEGIESNAAFMFGFISLCEAVFSGLMSICLVTATNEMVLWKTKILIIKIWSGIMIGSMIITIYYGVTAYKSSQGYIYVVIKVAIIWSTMLIVIRFYFVLKDKIAKYHINPKIVQNLTKEFAV